jgi:hypothetical protein
MTDDAPATSVPQLVADARMAFQIAVDRLLTDFQASWDSITREDWRTLRRQLLIQFDACIPLRATADPRLRQLVRDALFILSDDDCRLSQLEWRQKARSILQEPEARS